MMVMVAAGASCFFAREGDDYSCGGCGPLEKGMRESSSGLSMPRRGGIVQNWPELE